MKIKQNSGIKVHREIIAQLPGFLQAKACLNYEYNNLQCFFSDVPK
jgi:hypothetical protein